MTENEKRILTLLSKQGPLSKKELTEKGEMGWATVVKMIARLEDAGIVHCVGTDAQPEISGKNPLVYDLSDRNPLAIGIDVSYITTNIILTNLKNGVLAQKTYTTPENPTQEQLKDFLATISVQFWDNVVTRQDYLAGIGIGIPRWLVKPGKKIFTYLTAELESRLSTKVRIEESNVRNYTMYKKWVGKAFSLDDFILVTIRNGVGTGIFYQGHLVRGTHGMAGELGHLPIIDHGKPCRCGKQGCLETLINQEVLYQKYLKNVPGRDLREISSSTESEIHEGLTDLFSLAKQGNQQASAIIKEAAQYIGTGLTALLLILDIPNVIIAADFGPDGTVLIPHIIQEINRRIMPGIEYSVAYYPLERLGFAQGAALLILKEYFTKVGS